MTAQELHELSTKYLNGTATEDEKKRLHEWYVHGMDEEIKVMAGYADEQAMEAALYERISQSNKQEVPVKRIRWFRYAAAAAAIIILLSAGIYFATIGTSEKKTPDVIVQDIQPPSLNKATITLADGRRIILDTAGNGTLAMQGDVQLVKAADGQLVYKGSGNQILYNTLTNPRGSKVIFLTLTDGTKVWLNAESSLRYPATMIGNERRVEVTGEAYFEVAHNASKPFIVKNSYRNLEVQVLGTHFNINTYNDEPTADVTLLQGSIRLIKGATNELLRPGEQGRASSGITIVSNIDIEQVMAWKDGYFQFNRDGLDVVMRQMARWYDVEVSYEGLLPRRQFGGKISRNSAITDVFKILAINKVSFRIEGKKIIVMAN